MKKKLIITALFSAIVTTVNAATIQLSLTTAGTGVLTGLQRNDGTQGALIWGIVVDTAGNGFQGNSGATPYDSNFTFRPTATGGGYTGAIDTDGQVLSTVDSSGNATLTDDVLFVSVGGMLTTAFSNDGGGLAGTARPGSIAGVNYTGNGVAGGQSFAVIWFDVVAVASGVGATLNTAATEGLFYGMLTNADRTAPGGASLLLPAAQSGSLAAHTAFVGAEPGRRAEFTLGVAIPEPSTMLLGALGALGLLRRRR